MKTKGKIVLLIFIIISLLLSFLSTLHSQVVITTERFDTTNVKQKSKVKVLPNQFRDYVEFKKKIDSIQNKIK